MTYDERDGTGSSASRPARAERGGRRRNHKKWGVVFEQRCLGMWGPDAPPSANAADDDAAGAPRADAVSGSGEPGLWLPADVGTDFEALADCRARVPSRMLARFAADLYERGCRALHVRGLPDQVSLLHRFFDTLADAHPERHLPGGRTPYSVPDFDPTPEPLSDAVARFVLPAGGPATRLFVAVGSEADFKDMVRQFARGVGDLRERIIPWHSVMASGLVIRREN